MYFYLLKDVFLPVERFLLNCVWKERCTLSCGEVHLIASGEKNLLGCGERDIYL